MNGHVIPSSLTIPDHGNRKHRDGHWALAQKHFPVTLTRGQELLKAGSWAMKLFEMDLTHISSQPEALLHFSKTQLLNINTA